MSHLGRPEKGPENKYSLKHIIPNLQEKLGEVKFAGDCIGSLALQLSKTLGTGEIYFLKMLDFIKKKPKVIRISLLN